MKLEIVLQPKQKIAFEKSLKTPCLFYGGAKGGGKSYLVRAREVYRRLKHPGTTGLIIRKTYPELLSNHIRRFFIEYPIVKQWYRATEKAIYWPNGSVTEFSHLGTTDDVYNYQGREYEDISIDEITQHEEEVFKILRSSNRTTHKDVNPTMLLTGNPGGIGHEWAKRLFINRVFERKEEPSDFDFVQAKVYDNKALIDADPAYLGRLEALPEHKRRAYLEGDWDSFEGQVFAEFRRELHVAEPMFPKKEFAHFLSFDWGYRAPFSCHASALVPSKHEGKDFFRVVTYQEWYGTEKHPSEWARIIKEEARCRDFKKAYADPSMFNIKADGSISIAKEIMNTWKRLGKFRVTIKPGSKNRIQRVATVHNWLSIGPGGVPYWIITENCKNLIRTLPILVYDSHRIEDVDTSLEDHCLPANTLIHTVRGKKRINELVGESGYLLSREGQIKRFYNVRLTGFNSLYGIWLRNGLYVEATSKHPFLTKRGWVNASDIRSDDMIQCVYEGKNGKSDNSRIRRGEILQMRVLLRTLIKKVQGFKKVAQGCLEISLGVYSKWVSYSSQGWKQKQQPDRKFGIRQGWQSFKRSLEKSFREREGSEEKKILEDSSPRGGKVAQIKKGFGMAQEALGRKYRKSNEGKKTYLRYLWKGIHNEVSWKVNLLRAELQSKSVAYEKVRKTVSLPTKVAVYNLEVEDTQAFCVNGGIVVHNSYDSVGYLLSMMKWIDAKPGGVSRPKPKRKYQKQLIEKDGGILSLDTDKFAVAPRKTADWYHR